MNDKQIEERNELFDSAVREQLTGYEPKVPHALWNRISSELDKGEASDEMAPIAEHHERTMFGKWKFAAAAAVLLTLTTGTLLYTLNPTNALSTVPAIANKAATAPKAVSQPTATTPASVTENKTVAQAASVTKKAGIRSAASIPAKANATPVMTAKATEPATIEVAPTKDQTAQEMPLEFAPVTSQNNPVEVGNIPLASLNFLSTPTSLNDEITVIQSAPEKKRKHGKKEEATKVIVLGKKYDSKPDIRFQVPVRF